VKKLQGYALALAGLASATVTFLMAIQVMSPEVGAACTGLITAALFSIRMFVTPVEKVATLLEKPVGLVNQLLKDVAL
jgi:cobalamin biosynthesis protein CobD/CbiB